MPRFCFALQALAIVTCLLIGVPQITTAKRLSYNLPMGFQSPAILAEVKTDVIVTVVGASDSVITHVSTSPGTVNGFEDHQHNVPLLAANSVTITTISLPGPTSDSESTSIATSVLKQSQAATKTVSITTSTIKPSGVTPASTRTGTLVETKPLSAITFADERQAAENFTNEMQAFTLYLRQINVELGDLANVVLRLDELLQSLEAEIEAGKDLQTLVVELLLRLDWVNEGTCKWHVTQLLEYAALTHITETALWKKRCFRLLSLSFSQLLRIYIQQKVKEAVLRGNDNNE